MLKKCEHIPTNKTTPIAALIFVKTVSTTYVRILVKEIKIAFFLYKNVGKGGHAPYPSVPIPHKDYSHNVRAGQSQCETCSGGRGTHHHKLSPDWVHLSQNVGSGLVGGGKTLTKVRVTM